MKISIVSSNNKKILDKCNTVIKKLEKEFEIVKNGDICITLGGDGTFVHAARRYDKPLLPVRIDANMSSGFYSDVSIKDIDKIIDNLKNGLYKIIDMANKLELNYKNKKYYAVNEVSLNHVKQEVSFKMYDINKRKKQILPFIIGGDGVIISSKIGSTAYNRSALGPILLSNKVMCITLLNPDSPYKNSLVVNSSSRIEIEVIKYSGIIRYDGVDVAIIEKGDRFDVGMSDKKLEVVKLDFKSENLGNKLERIMKNRMKRY